MKYSSINLKFMKLKIIFTTTVVTLMALAGYFGYANHHNEFSDMQLANIEALVHGEFIVGKGWECFEVVYDDVTNPQFFTIINCNGCHTTSAVYVNNPGFCTLSGMYD